MSLKKRVYFFRKITHNFLIASKKYPKKLLCAKFCKKIITLRLLGYDNRICEMIKQGVRFVGQPSIRGQQPDTTQKSSSIKIIICLRKS